MAIRPDLTTIAAATTYEPSGSGFGGFFKGLTYPIVGGEESSAIMVENGLNQKVAITWLALGALGGAYLQYGKLSPGLKDEDKERLSLWGLVKSPPVEATNA